MSRLTIEVTDQQHQSLKAMAALQGKTIKAYATAILFANTLGEDAALHKLKALLTQRMAESAHGAVTAQSFSEIAEDVFQTGRDA